MVGAGFKTLLLLRPSRHIMMPVSTQAFQQTQGSRRKLLERCGDTLIVDREGQVLGIADIQFLGPFDRTLMPILLHWFFGVGSIRVVFTVPQLYTLEDVKRLIEDCLKSEQTQSDWDLDNPEKTSRFVERIRAAASFQALFKALRLPKPDNALDLL